MTHEHDPATCDVALLRDAADRRVAQIGTECVTEEDARILQDTAEAMGDQQALLWLAHSETTGKNWYKACGYSERFIAICEHFRAQGYDYLWFDADRETPVGQGPAAVGPVIHSRDTLPVCHTCDMVFPDEVWAADHARTPGEHRMGTLHSALDNIREDSLVKTYSETLAEIRRAECQNKIAKAKRPPRMPTLEEYRRTITVDRATITDEPVNARLLAALKGLLDAEALTDDDYYASIDGALDEARAAIAEAETAEPDLHLFSDDEVDAMVRQGLIQPETGRWAQAPNQPIVAAEKAAPVVIRLDIWKGVDFTAHGLPPGITLEVHDLENHDEPTPHCDVHPDENCCVHIFTGGE